MSDRFDPGEDSLTRKEEVTFRKLSESVDSYDEILAKTESVEARTEEQSICTSPRHPVSTAKIRLYTNIINRLHELLPRFDKLLLYLSLLFAIIEGVCPPLATILFGQNAQVLTLIDQSGFLGEEQSKYLPCNCAGQNITGSTNGSEFSRSQFVSFVTTSSLFFFFITLLIFTSSYLRYYCLNIVIERLCHRLTRYYYRSTLERKYTGSSSSKNNCSDLAARHEDNIAKIRSGNQIGNLIKQTSLFSSGLIIAVYNSWQLSLTVIAFMPIVGLIDGYTDSTEQNYKTQQRHGEQKAISIASNVITSIRDTMLLGGQKKEVVKFANQVDTIRDTSIKSQAKIAAARGASTLILYSTYGLFLYISSGLILSGSSDAKSAITALMSIVLIPTTLSKAIASTKTISTALSSASDVLSEVEDSQLQSEIDDGIKLASVKTDIRFDNVSVCQADIHLNIESMSIQIKSNETVAICGEANSGKHVIADILLRFTNPNRGAVYLDNCDICDLSTAWMRSLIGVIDHEAVLFDCSIFENITLGTTKSDQKTLERVIQVSKMAKVHKFIKRLKHGYETLCLDSGANIPQVQRQRIAIARALIGDPKILIINEPKSPLDPIYGQLTREATRNRTSIVIVEKRLDLIKDADLVYVMSEGKIVEQGKHDELASRVGQYRQLLDCALPQIKTDTLVDSSKQSDISRLNTRISESKSLRQSTSSIFIERKVTTKTERFTSKLVETSELSHAISSRYSATIYETLNKPFAFIRGMELASGRMRGLSLRDSLSMFEPEWFVLGCAALASLLFGSLYPIFGLLYAQIYYSYARTGSELIDSANYWSRSFIIYGFVFGFIVAAKIYLASLAVESSIARIRVGYFTSVVRQPMCWFDSGPNSSQRLMSSLTSDISRLKSILTLSVCSIIAIASSTLITLLCAFYFGWNIAIVVLLAVPLYVYVALVRLRVLRLIKGKQNLQSKQSAGFIDDTFKQVKKIQSLNQEKFFVEKFANKLNSQSRDTDRQTRVIGLCQGLNHSLIYLFYSAVFGWGGYLIAYHSLNPIDFYRVFLVSSITIIAVAGWLSASLHQDLSESVSSFENINRQLQTQPLVDSLSKGGIKPELTGAVQFADVCFRHPTSPDEPILRGVNLKLESGDKFTLVGGPKSGKSSLVSLLVRLYEPDAGVIRLDGYDSRCINLRHLRLSIGLISHDLRLFYGSIMDNILYGLDTSLYSTRSIVDACKQAEVHDFIESLPNGYNTIIDEQHCQWTTQRKLEILIARTFVRNPKIIILDEVTKNLNTDNKVS